MKLALFLGCQIPARLMQYEAASRAVLASLGLDVADVEGFNCCGYPLRNISFKACILLSARNLALAERKQRDIVSLCQCCFGTLAKVNRMLQEDSQLRNEINETLEQEGLTYKGSVQVKHLLQVLYHDVGVEALRERVKRRHEGLRVATHYGCHVLRPSSVVQFDDPVNPTLFDRLVEVTGARSVQFVAADGGYRASLTLREALAAGVLIAWEFDDRPFPRVHGFPLRVVAPGQTGSVWVKWLGSIVVQ